MSRAQLAINQRQYLELEKLGLGAYAPLDGFMTEQAFASVVADVHLPDGQLFPLPVVLDCSTEQARTVRGASRITLTFTGEAVGELTPASVYQCDKAAVAEQVFGTRDVEHPGVAHFYRMGEWFIGGSVRLMRRVPLEFSDDELTPAQTRAIFAERGWTTVVGFQTRNVPHRAHEYLLRLALEQADGLFIQPLVGRKKRGDYNPRAILEGYRELIDRFLPKERVVLGVLSTAMRYAGPREALFHALVRRNYGCTHFIVGRDHAGVGTYYAKYAAHELTRRYERELGIQILRYFGPFHCAICGGIVTERSCPHERLMPEAVRHISGTLMRRLLAETDRQAMDGLMRPEVVERIRGLPLFIEEDAE